MDVALSPAGHRHGLHERPEVARQAVGPLDGGLEFLRAGVEPEDLGGRAAEGDGQEAELVARPQGRDELLEACSTASEARRMSASRMKESPKRMTGSPPQVTPSYPNSL